MTELITSSIKDISRPEQKGVPYKTDEDIAHRIKRQKKEFFTLLTTQLQHQDPLSPMETNEMTQQIFSINHVEQQLDTNRLLEDIKRYFSVAHDSSYINYIGKFASFEGNEVQLIRNEATLNYELLEDAKDANIEVCDRFGNVVDTISISPRKGLGKTKWIKKDDIPNDSFTFRVDAKTADNNQANAKTYVYGPIDSLYLEDGKQYFEINQKKVPADSVRKIVDSSQITTTYLNHILDAVERINDNTQNSAD
jgi:flagellar basal-body rod modification protein FlgD